MKPSNFQVSQSDFDNRSTETTNRHFEIMLPVFARYTCPKCKIGFINRTLQTVHCPKCQEVVVRYDAVVKVILAINLFRF